MSPTGEKEHLVPWATDADPDVRGQRNVTSRQPLVSTTVSLEIPTGSLRRVLAALARLGAGVATPTLGGELSVVETVLPAARVNDLQRRLAELTGGEGVLESTFDGYQPVHGDPPTRRRTTASPLNLAEYTAELAGRPTSSSHDNASSK